METFTTALVHGGQLGGGGRESKLVLTGRNSQYKTLLVLCVCGGGLFDESLWSLGAVK